MKNSGKFNKEDIDIAYRKLKHTVFYDSTYSFLRSQLAEYEQTASGEFKDSSIRLSEKFNYLAEKLNNSSNEYIEKLINEIDCWILPKTIDNAKGAKKENEEIGLITNATYEDKIRIIKDFKLINAHIELHIISTLWIIKGGYAFENEMPIKPFGNKLELSGDQSGIVNGLRLFKPYFKNYKLWRDKAFKKARQIINEKENTVIISLDITNYYPSVKLDFKIIKNTINNNFSGIQRTQMLKLTNILKKIHSKYKNIIYLGEEKNSKLVKGLPIGLQSSSVLANWYLKDFDDDIKNKINPIYYGRYVDDILIVISNPNLDLSEIKKSVYDYYFIRNNIFELTEDKDGQYEILDKDGVKTGLIIQNTKTKIYYFKHDEPIALLDKIEQELKIETSEFRYLPEEDRDNRDFFLDAHYLSFDGSINKLRNVSGFGVNLFGASKYLAKKIKSSINSDRQIDKKISKQINIFFKGGRAIEAMKLWEKSITYFVATKDIKGLTKFIHSVKNAISNIHTNLVNLDKTPDDISINDWQLYNSEQENKLTKQVKDSLYTVLAGSIAMSLALDTVFLKKFTLSNDATKINRAIKELNEINSVKILFNDIFQHIRVLKRSNLIRHHFVESPMLNFTKFGIENDCSYFDPDLIPEAPSVKFFEDENYKIQIGIPPRFIHFHEIALAMFREELASFTESNSNKEYIDLAKKQFFKINNIEKDIGISDVYTFNSLTQKKYENKSEEIVVIKKIEINSEYKKSTLTVGIVNYKVNDENIENSYLKTPNYSNARREEIYNIFNSVLDIQKKQNIKVDVLIMPELSIPYKSLNWVANFAQQSQIMLVFGIEYWINKNLAYNFIANFIPFTIKSYEDSKDTFGALLPLIRIKNHYAPSEKLILKKYRYDIPMALPSKYFLINWRGINYSVFNCFELADIQHRALFRSHVELLFACEYNLDINYYSSIVESIVRDVYCYFIQSNNSECGDSRVTRPTSSIIMDQMQIKGGINNAIIIDKIDIEGIKKSQIEEDSDSEKQFFKPKPPGYDFKSAMRRWGKNLNSK